MARKVGIIGTKGGTTKTSNCANLGGMLADMGQKVLLIDGDDQQSLSAYYPLAKRATHGLKKFITTADPKDCISETNIPNLHIIVNDDPNNELALWFSKSSSHFEYLKYAIKAAEGDYDYILIDTKGEKNGALQESVIKAVDQLINPITPEFMSAKEFKRGTLQMMSRLKGPDNIELFKLPPLLMVICRSKGQTNANKKIITELRKIAFEEAIDVSVLNTIIVEKEAYNLACGKKIPVHRMEPVKPNKSSPTPSALTLQLTLVRELLPHLCDIYPEWEGMPQSAEIANI